MKVQTMMKRFASVASALAFARMVPETTYLIVWATGDFSVCGLNAARSYPRGEIKSVSSVRMIEEALARGEQVNL